MLSMIMPSRLFTGSMTKSQIYKILISLY